MDLLVQARQLVINEVLTQTECSGGPVYTAARYSSHPEVTMSI
jgi:hypothetical protein